MTELPTRQEVLEAVTSVFAEYGSEDDQNRFFELLLGRTLELTGSEYGFIGRVMHDGEGQPYLKTYAVTNIAWNEATRRWYEENAANGLEFHNLNTLFGACLTSKAVVIANDPARDPRAGGTPAGHPALRHFVGVPLEHRQSMIGMLGLANRPGGYSHSLLDVIRPFVMAGANAVHAWTEEQLREGMARAVRRSQQTYQALVEAAPDAILAIDTTGTLLEANQAAGRLFGYSREELIGAPVTMLMSESDGLAHTHHVGRYLETGVKRVIGVGRRVQGRRKDGLTIPIELAVTEVPGDRGVRFVGILRDVSDRVAAQTERLQAHQDLQRAHANLEAILNEHAVGCVSLDAGGKVVFSNRFCVRVGLPEVADGAHWTELLPLQGNARSSLADRLRVPLPWEDRLLAELTGVSGGRISLEIQVSVDPREQGGRLLFLYDVTRLRGLERRVGDSTYSGLVGGSEPMLRLFSLINTVARGDWNVLIDGETGTGKELVARAIHEHSLRREGPFIAVNCGALPEALIASTLFGHLKGSFSGAYRDQPGVFEAAQGGTLLLDEIGDLQPALQTNLLRVLGEREVMPVGAVQARPVDVRVLFATHRDLAADVSQGRFRADLYYRLRVARITAPPLRERRGDIKLLVAYFLGLVGPVSGGTRLQISDAALEVLESYTWPGNVRELASVVEFAAMLANGGRIDVPHLPAEVRGMHHAVPDREYSQVGAERDRILAAIEAAEGSRSAAALHLGMSRATLYRHMKRLGIPSKGSLTDP